MSRQKYECPTCGTLLTKEAYFEVLRLTQAQEEQHAAELAATRKQARESERDKIASLTRDLRKSNERIKQLERGQTPQTAGLDDQHKMATRLQKEFEPLGDRVTETGQGGD